MLEQLLKEILKRDPKKEVLYSDTYTYIHASTCVYAYTYRGTIQTVTRICMHMHTEVYSDTYIHAST